MYISRRLGAQGRGRQGLECLYESKNSKKVILRASGRRSLYFQRRDLPEARLSLSSSRSTTLLRSFSVRQSKLITSRLLEYRGTQKRIYETSQADQSLLAISQFITFAIKENVGQPSLIYRSKEVVISQQLKVTVSSFVQYLAIYNSTIFIDIQSNMLVLAY